MKSNVNSRQSGSNSTISPTGTLISRNSNSLVEGKACVATKWALEPLRSATTAKMRDHNQNPYAYHELHRAIYWMEHLPQGHDMHLDSTLAELAREYLAYLQHHTAAAPPKLFNDAGEAVTFVWSEGAAKRYLSVTDEDAAIMDVFDPAAIKQHHLLPLGREAVHDLINSFGQGSRSAE